MIRPAALSDLSALLEMALDHAKNHEGVLTANEDKIKRAIRSAISSASSFAAVSETNGKIDGALLGVTSENLWANKHNCQILIWKSSRAGVGVELLRAFKEWLMPRKAIRIAGLVFDFEVRKGVKRILTANGFAQRGGAYLWHRGAANGSV